MSTKSGGREKRDAATKFAEHRLSVLELARELGNVAEVCRRRGLDRTRGDFGSLSWTPSTNRPPVGCTIVSPLDTTETVRPGPPQAAGSRSHSLL